MARIQDLTAIIGILLCVFIAATVSAMHLQSARNGHQEVSEGCNRETSSCLHYIIYGIEVQN